MPCTDTAPTASSAASPRNQTSNPSVPPAAGQAYANVTGYKSINTPYEDFNFWGGLQYSAASAFMDGSVNHGNWYYATPANTAWRGGIPAVGDGQVLGSGLTTGPDTYEQKGRCTGTSQKPSAGCMNVHFNPP